MYLGRIVEEGAARDVIERPRHPYTKALLSVVPRRDPRRRVAAQVLRGETPNPTNVPVGCPFHPRCPLVASGEAARLGIEERCRGDDLELHEVAPGHRAACHAL
jgi:peptide/nickel transport system ATP-binding protein